MANLDPSTLLVIGSGGREHALVWALARSRGVSRVYVAPGNGGTAREPRAENVPIADSDIGALAAFARDRGVGLTVVGPEKPLPLGVVDRFRAAGLPVFGPTRAAARIETSKAWARDFMRRYGVPHPAYTAVEGWADAERAVRDLGGRCVVKADGLAAGKGVVVCGGVDEALAAARDMLVDRAFGDAGARVVIEERLEGPELSLMAVTDGTDYVLLRPAQDYKRLRDGDRGPNTGGMGAFAPAQIGTPDVLARAAAEIIQPALSGMRAEGHPFTGCLYCGLMLTDRGPSVIEFNARFGDPETQVQLPLVASDLADLLRAAATGGVGGVNFRQHEDRAAVCVALAPDGYPGPSAKGEPIHGLDQAEAIEGVKVFHAGTRVDAGTGRLVTAGGRVLNVVCVRGTLHQAVTGAYAAIGREPGAASPAPGTGVWFPGMQYRADIAARALAGAD